MPGEKDYRTLAAEALRLRDDPALAAILFELETQAVRVAMTDADTATRERARQLALAIGVLRNEIQDRIDTVEMREHVRKRQLASE